MPITTAMYSFDETNVNNAPDKAGVYALYDGSTVIYYGRAQGGTVTIRSRLQSHLSGSEGSCTKSATNFNSELASNPITREEELLISHKRAYGKLPRCNERVG